MNNVVTLFPSSFLFWLLLLLFETKINTIQCKQKRLPHPHIAGRIFDMNKLLNQLGWKNLDGGGEYTTLVLSAVCRLHRTCDNENNFFIPSKMLLVFTIDKF